MSNEQQYEGGLSVTAKTEGRTLYVAVGYSYNTGREIIWEDKLIGPDAARRMADHLNRMADGVAAARESLRMAQADWRDGIGEKQGEAT